MSATSTLILLMSVSMEAMSAGEMFSVTLSILGQQMVGKFSEELSSLSSEACLISQPGLENTDFGHEMQVVLSEPYSETGGVNVRLGVGAWRCAMIPANHFVALVAQIKSQAILELH